MQLTRTKLNQHAQLKLIQKAEREVTEREQVIAGLSLIKRSSVGGAYLVPAQNDGLITKTASGSRAGRSAL